MDQQTRVSNRLTAALKAYYPQVLQWFENLDAPVALDFLERWPTLEELQKAKPATWQKFLQEHQCREEAKNQARIQSMRKAVAATTDFAVLTAGRAAVCAAVRLLRNLGQSIRQYDRQIDALVKTHPDFAIFDSLPGAGPVLVPRLIAAFGTQRDRYQSAAEMQPYSGIAPVTEASGQQHWVHWRWSCPKFLRQSFYEWAGHSILHYNWAEAFYRAQCQDKGKSHHAAVRSLAYKWIRIAFRCWKDRTPMTTPATKPLCNAAASRCRALPHLHSHCPFSGLLVEVSKKLTLKTGTKTEKNY